MDRERKAVRKFYGQFDPQVDRVAWGYFPEGYIGHAIGVGECDGIFYSNTYAFEEAGWVCLAIEPNPEWWPALVKNRRHTQPYAIANRTGTAVLNVYDIRQGDHSAITSIKPDIRLVEGYGATLVEARTVPTRTMEDAIIEAGIFPKIDYVSIDTEGSEIDVMLGFNVEKWNPKLIILENNYDDKEPLEHMARRGYRRDNRIGVNDFYCKQ